MPTKACCSFVRATLSLQYKASACIATRPLFPSAAGQAVAFTCQRRNYTSCHQLLLKKKKKKERKEKTYTVHAELALLTVEKELSAPLTRSYQIQSCHTHTNHTPYRTYSTAPPVLSLVPLLGRRTAFQRLKSPRRDGERNQDDVYSVSGLF